LDLDSLLFYIEVHGRGALLDGVSAEEKLLIESAGLKDFRISSNSGELKSITVYDDVDPNTGTAANPDGPESQGSEADGE
jgi:hypothetical protein